MRMTPVLQNLQPLLSVIVTHELLEEMSVSAKSKYVTLIR